MEFETWRTISALIGMIGLFAWGTVGWVLYVKKDTQTKSKDVVSLGHGIHRSVQVMVTRMVVEMMRPYVHEMQAHAEFCSAANCVYRDLKTGCYGLEDCPGKGYCLFCDFDEEEEDTIDGICN